MTQYALRCCAILKNVKNPVEMENHLRRLVNETGYDREILLRQIGVSAPQAAQEPRRRMRAEAAPGDELLAERALIAMLAAGLIPPALVKPSDFGDAVHIELAARLTAGESVNAYIEELTDETIRAKALQAINYQPVPDAQEDAVKMAENCLKTIRRNRVTRRIEEIKRRIGTASPEEKSALYQQMTAMMSELDD